MTEAPAPKGYFYPAQRDALNLAVEYVTGSGVHGDVVEFGCYQGTTATILAQAMAKAGKDYGYSEEAHGIAQRRLWVFDSFEGFPEATDPIDAAAPHIRARVWYAGQPAGGAPAVVHQRCAEQLGMGRVSVVPGWFKDTLAQLPADQRFSLVHIDCDYYESTSQVLDHLFANAMLTDGATVLFDDWYCNRGSPDYGEQRAWNEAAARFCPPYKFTDWGPYGVVGRRFIVHL